MRNINIINSKVNAQKNKIKQILLSYIIILYYYLIYYQIVLSYIFILQILLSYFKYVSHFLVYKMLFCVRLAPKFSAHFLGKKYESKKIGLPNLKIKYLHQNCVTAF